MSKLFKIKDLQKKWEKEKDCYRTKEIGSGTQKFVKDFLKSEDIFYLKEGLISTSLLQRKNEFTEESQTKARRRTDIIIYINQDIIIPVEIEKYGNIEAGLSQLLQYQLDLDKKYGILTDGYTWQFYNNAYLIKEFNLNQIFSESQLFKEFWNEYIKPENYYLSFFEEKGQLKISSEDFSVDKKRQDFFRDITTLIRSFKNKLQIEGYLNHLEDKKTKRKTATEITYAYIIQFILYKTLVDNDFGNFAEEFNNIVEKIPQHIKEKRYKDILGIIDGISAHISKNIYRPFTKEQEFINDKLQELYRNIENKLSDVSPWLDIFVFIKKYNFANIENEIFGYIYENYLKELYEETKKGQYFTDPAVVNFMLQQIGFTSKKIKERHSDDKDSISLIDPSAGSGTFLYSAVNQIIKSFGSHSEEKSKQIEEIVNKNIFGLDIEEFPIYLAEMNILMRMLPLIIGEKYNNPIDKKIKVFLTKDSIAEFLNTALKNTIYDIDTIATKGGQLSMGFKELDLGYKSYVREENDLEEMKKSLENLSEIPRRRFDYVIGNPPYVGYNECSKQKVLIFELMKQNKVRIKLNDIYGVNLHSIPSNQKKYAPKPNLYVFFIALGIALLKDNCKLCYIIPQTILTAGDLDVIRYHLAKFTTIEKIITFSGKMFIGRGLKQDKPVATSSLILVLKKRIPSILHQVEVINYKDSNDSIEEVLQNILTDNKKKISKKIILQKKLLQNVANWNFIKQNKKFLDFYDEYKRNTEDISIYYEHILAEQKFGSRFYFDIGFVLNSKEVTKIRDANNFYELLDFKTFYGYSRFAPKAYYPKNRDKIKLTQNSQGYITLDQQYKIIWSIKNPDKFCFTDRPIIFYMGKASIICSNNRGESLYLFSLLNCPIIKLILEAHLKSEQEKEYLIPIKAIKEFVHIPKITEDNQFIKNEIIKQTEKMLVLEEKRLSDFVNFSKIILQKFDKVFVENNDLILERNNEKIKFVIKENINLIKKILKEKIESKREKITLSELKSLSIIDYEKQQKIKDYIDDLVFVLYFKIRLEKLGLNQAENIKMRCTKNPYYKLIN